MAGLLDVYERFENPQALQVLEGMASWADWRTGRLPEEQMQRTLQIEFGGMNEVLANLSAVTGNPRYLAVARRFDHHAVMDPAQGRDTLTTLHANTQTPSSSAPRVNSSSLVMLTTASVRNFSGSRSRCTAATSLAATASANTSARRPTCSRPNSLT
jgi:DUF1680 family protein